VQYNILVLPLESLSDAVEKKNQVWKRRDEREREILCVCVCVFLSLTPFALVYVFGNREGADLVCVCQFAPHLTTQKYLACALHRAWKGTTKKRKKTKEERPWSNWHYDLLVSFFSLFFFFFSFLKIERKKEYNKGMVLLHTLKCKSPPVNPLVYLESVFSPMIFFDNFWPQSWGRFWKYVFFLV
jgi:hypothetical protein